MQCCLVVVVKAYGKCRIDARDTGSIPTLTLNSCVRRTSTIFLKKRVLPLLAPICSKDEQIMNSSKGRSLLSHNRQALTRAIQNSQMKRNFGVLVDSLNFFVTIGRNQTSFFIISLFIIIQIWSKSQISLSAFPASALQCQQPQCRTIFVRNRSINCKSNQSLWFSTSLDICLTIKAKVLL